MRENVIWVKSIVLNKQAKCKRKKEKAQKNRSESGLQKKKEVSDLARVKWAGGKRERGGQGSSHAAWQTTKRSSALVLILNMGNHGRILKGNIRSVFKGSLWLTGRKQAAGGQGRSQVTR